MTTTTKRPTAGGRVSGAYSVQRFESVRLRRLRCAGLRRHGNPASWRNLHGYEFTGCASHFLTLSPITRALIERDIVADIRERPHEWEHPEVAEIVEERPVAPNLVLDQAFNNWFTGAYYFGNFNRYCGIGTGTTAPAVSDIGLGAEVRRTGNMLTGSGNCGSTLNTTAGTLANKRTHDFPVQVANENFTELCWSHVATTGNNANSRVLISGGTVSALVGQQVRVVHTATLTCSPIARQSGTIVMGGTPGWPHPSGSATDTAGEWQWCRIGFTGVKTNDGGLDATSTYGCGFFEPANPQEIIPVWWGTLTLPAFGADPSRSGEFPYQYVGNTVGSGVWSTYVSGSFTRSVSFYAIPPAAWNSTDGIAGYALYRANTIYSNPGMAVKFTQPQTKTSLDALKAPGFTITLSR